MQVGTASFLSVFLLHPSILWVHARVLHSRGSGRQQLIHSVRKCKSGCGHSNHLFCMETTPPRAGQETNEVGAPMMQMDRQRTGTHTHAHTQRLYNASLQSTTLTRDRLLWAVGPHFATVVRKACRNNRTWRGKRNEWTANSVPFPATLKMRNAVAAALRCSQRS